MGAMTGKSPNPTTGGIRTGLCCPQSLWGLHPWRCSEVVWTWSWAGGSGWPCLNKGLDQRPSRGPFPAQPPLQKQTAASAVLLPLACALCPGGGETRWHLGGGDQSAVGAQLVSSERAEGGELELLETPGFVCLFYHFCWCFSGRLAFGGRGGGREKQPPFETLIKTGLTALKWSG